MFRAGFGFVTLFRSSSFRAVFFCCVESCVRVWWMADGGPTVVHYKNWYMKRYLDFFCHDSFLVLQFLSQWIQIFLKGAGGWHVL